MATTAEQIIELAPDVKIYVVLTTPESRGYVRSPTLVFLHFWGGSSSTYAPTIQHLSLRYPTISLDFRGWGKSTGPAEKEAYSIPHLTSDVEEVLQKLHSSGRQQYILIGHSMGGKVAQAVAGRKVVSGISGLVLVAAAPPGPLRLPDEQREQQIHAFDSRESAEFVTRNVITASHLDIKTVQKLVEDMVSGSAEARAYWPGLWMAEDVREWAKKVDVPILAVGASSDPVEPIQRIKSEVCKFYASSQLVVLECGHLIPVEKPKELAAEISKFADSVVA